MYTFIETKKKSQVKKIVVMPWLACVSYMSVIGSGNRDYLDVLVSHMAHLQGYRVNCVKGNIPILNTFSG